MRLSGISYKMNKSRRISGLQMHFSNGFASPLFESEVDSKWGWQFAGLDPNDSIGSIETYVSEFNGKKSIQALRFKDRYGVMM